MYSFDTKAWARFWRVSVRTAQNWGKAGRPVTEPTKMAAMIIGHGLGGKNCLAKAQEIMLKHEGRIKADDGNDSVGQTPLLGVEGEREGLGFDAYEAQAIDKRQASAYFWGKMLEAAKVGNSAAETYYHDRFLRNDKAIKDDDLHAKKMGLADGMIINRETFERMVFALAFWMVRGVEMDLKELAPLCLGLTYQEEAYGVLDRFFMRKRFLAAFEKASVSDSGVSLPKWCFGAIQRAVDVFFEVDPSDEDDVAAYETFVAAIQRSKGEVGDA